MPTDTKSAKKAAEGAFIGWALAESLSKIDGVHAALREASTTEGRGHRMRRKTKRASAPFVQEVHTCEDCPMRSEPAHSTGFYFCTHPNAPAGIGFRREVNTFDAPMPKACPLRDQDITLTRASTTGHTGESEAPRGQREGGSGV